MWSLALELASLMQDPPAPPQPEAVVAPVAFHPGSLTTVNGIAFATGGRELFVSRRVDETDARGRERVRIFLHRRNGDEWSAPEPVAFSDRHADYQPFFFQRDGTLYHLDLALVLQAP